MKEGMIRDGLPPVPSKFAPAPARIAKSAALPPKETPSRAVPMNSQRVAERRSVEGSLIHDKLIESSTLKAASCS